MVARNLIRAFTSPPLVAPARPVPFKARANLAYRRVGFTLTIEQRQTSIANVYSITYNTLVWISRGRVWEQKRAQKREQTFQPPAQGLMNPSEPSAFSSYVSHVVFLYFCCCKITTFHIRSFVHLHLFFNHFNKNLH